MKVTREEAAAGRTVTLRRAVDASYGAACSYAKSGETEAALEALEECLDAGDLDAERWQLDPDLDSLRQDPRFQSLLSRIEDRARHLVPLK